MQKRDLILLFSVSLTVYTAALMLLPFLSIMALSYPGIGAEQTGLFLAFVWLGLAAGTMISGWLAERFKRRKLLIQISTGMSLAALALIGTANSLWLLALLIGSAWFALGITTTLVRVIAGVLADEAERGRVFGIIGAATPLGALIGGLVGGPIVDRWGFEAMFLLAAAIFVLQFVLVYFIRDTEAPEPAGPAPTPCMPGVHVQDDILVEGFMAGAETQMPDATGAGAAEAVQPEAAGRFTWTPGFRFLLAASLVTFAALSAVIMARPIQMDRLAFDGAAISSVLVFGGLVGIPATFFLGVLSDKFGRKNLFIVCLLLVIPGIAILVNPGPLWHFWFSEAGTAFVGISNAVGAALAADLVPKKQLDLGMAYFSTAAWIGSIIGFAATGYVLDGLGLGPMFAWTAAVMAAAALLALPIPGRAVTAEAPAAAD